MSPFALLGIALVMSLDSLTASPALGAGVALMGLALLLVPRG